MKSHSVRFVWTVERILDSGDTLLVGVFSEPELAHGYALLHGAVVDYLITKFEINSHEGPLE